MRLVTIVLTVLMTTSLAFAERGRAPERPEERSGVEAKKAASPEEIRKEIEKEKAASKARAQGAGSAGAAKLGGTGTAAKAHEAEKSRTEIGKQNLGKMGRSQAETPTEIKSEADMIARIKASNVEGKEEILREERALLEKVKDEREALEGKFIQSQLFSEALGKETKLTGKGTNSFLKSILERLKRSKEVSKEDLEATKSLVCGAQCGHRGMAPACRKISRLLQALNAVQPALTATAISAFTLAFLDMDTSGKSSTVVKLDDSKASQLTVTGLDVEHEDEVLKPALGGSTK